MSKFVFKLIYCFFWRNLGYILRQGIDFFVERLVGMQLLCDFNLS